MSLKLEKIAAEREKARRKRDEWEERRKEWDRKYHEQENSEICEMVHAQSLTPDQFDELMQTLNLPMDELKKFAADVLERFDNPYVEHQVTSIMLNSFPKYQTRDLPGLKTYLERKGELPKGLVLGLAAIITYYKGGVRADGAEITPNDAPEIMQLLKDLWATGDTRKVAEGVLAAKDLIWGEHGDLNAIPGLTDMVTGFLNSIQEKGMLETVKSIL